MNKGYTAQVVKAMTTQYSESDGNMTEAEHEDPMEISH